MPTLRQWEYFVSAADHGSFTIAAERLHVSQPGLSQQIRVLEHELGSAVFERLTRGIRLTPLGRTVLPHARAIAADARRAEAAAAAAVGAAKGSLDVVTISSIGLGVLPAVLEAWGREHPDVDIDLIEHHTVDAVVAGMHAGEGDVAIAPMPRSWDGPQQLIGREEFVVVAHREHPLADRESARMQEFAGDRWVQFAEEHGLAGVLERFASEADFTPSVAMRTSQTAAVPRYAAAGVGVALVPGNILDGGFTGSAIRLDPPRTRAVRAFTRAEPDPLVGAFVQTALRHADLRGVR